MGQGKHIKTIRYCSLAKGETVEQDVTRQTPQPAPFVLTRPMVEAFYALPVPASTQAVLLTAQALPPERFHRYCQQMHQALEADQALEVLFWWQQALPDAEKRTLETLMTFCAHAVIIQLWWPALPPCTSISKTPRLVGVGWLTDIVPGEQATMSVWYAKRYRQEQRPTAMTRAVIGWALQSLGLKMLWGQTIFPAAVQHLRECGGTVWATVPDLIFYRGQRHPLSIVRVSADTWAANPEGI